VGFCFIRVIDDPIIILSPGKADVSFGDERNAVLECANIS
jgi:hypothetical protein